MPEGSVVAKVTRVAVFDIKGDVHNIIFDADGPDYQFGTEVLPDALRDLATRAESGKVLIVLENGMEVGITRTGEEVRFEIWPMLEARSRA